jgi:hypothetical protein
MSPNVFSTSAPAIDPNGYRTHEGALQAWSSLLVSLTSRSSEHRGHQNRWAFEPVEIGTIIFCGSDSFANRISRRSLACRNCQEIVSVNAGIGVLANHRSAGINALHDGSDSTGIVNRNWCGSVWELQKRVMPASVVNVSSYEFSSRINVPNDSRDAVGHIIGLERSVLQSSLARDLLGAAGDQEEISQSWVTPCCPRRDLLGQATSCGCPDRLEGRGGTG